MPTARAHGLEVGLCTLVTAPAPEADTAAPATHGPRPLHTRCALNAPPPPPSLPGRVHWVVYAAAAHTMEMTARDRPARRCIASGDDRRCERGHPHSALALGLRAAARVASLPTWNVTGGLSQIRTHTRRLERSCFTSLRSAHGPRPSVCGLILPPAARYRPSRPQGGLNAQRNVALCCGALWRLRCTLHLHRQPDLATVKCVSAAINELYEPGSSADRIDASEIMKDLAARSIAIGPISSRLVNSKRLGKLDRQYLEAAVLSMSGEESWSSVAVAMDKNGKYSVTGLSVRRPEVPPQRVCSSPGCNLPDYHGGPCSHDRSPRLSPRQWMICGRSSFAWSGAPGLWRLEPP